MKLGILERNIPFAIKFCSFCISDCRTARLDFRCLIESPIRCPKGYLAVSDHAWLFQPRPRPRPRHRIHANFPDNRVSPCKCILPFSRLRISVFLEAKSDGRARALPTRNSRHRQLHVAAAFRPSVRPPAAADSGNGGGGEEEQAVASSASSSKIASGFGKERGMRIRLLQQLPNCRQLPVDRREVGYHGRQRPDHRAMQWLIRLRANAKVNVLLAFLSILTIDLR